VVAGPSTCAKRVMVSMDGHGVFMARTANGAEAAFRERSVGFGNTIGDHLKGAGSTPDRFDNDDPTSDNRGPDDDGCVAGGRPSGCLWTVERARGLASTLRSSSEGRRVPVPGVGGVKHRRALAMRGCRRMLFHDVAMRLVAAATRGHRRGHAFRGAENASLVRGWLSGA
jgi:hypothetical protein